MSIPSFVRTVIVASICWVTAAHAVEMTAEIDRPEIADDESVTLQVKVKADNEVPMEEPQFAAPDFETINQFQSSYIQSYYDNGKVGAVFERTFTYVLRPKKQGKLSIDQIKTKVGEELLNAPALTVQVSTGGQATPPPANYGGAGNGLRGSGKVGKGAAVFVRAEVDHTSVVKGEPITVSYYFYSRHPSFNVVAEKYPTMSGFLKEEIDMPVLTGRLSAQIVTLDGVAYHRALLARYSASALKEGKLIIDSMYTKAQYVEQPRARTGGGGFGDEEDLFFQFFNQLAPRIAQLKTDPITIEVQSLPPAPAGFDGAIGEFNWVAVADRTSLKVNESMTWTLKLEGKGNFANLKMPKVELPDGLQLFESKDQLRGGKAGTQGEKIFESLIVPRSGGTYTLPSVPFTYFNPRKKQYVTIKSDGIPVSVEGVAESTSADSLADRRSDQTSKTVQADTTGPKSEPVLDTSGWKLPKYKLRFRGRELILQLLALLMIALSVVGVIWIRKNPGRGPSRGRVLRGETERLRQEFKTLDWAAVSSEDALRFYGRAQDHLMDQVSEVQGQNVRALTRLELQETVRNAGKVGETLWNRIVTVLEYGEQVRFGGGSHFDRVRAKEVAQETFECIQALEEIHSSPKSAKV